MQAHRIAILCLVTGCDYDPHDRFESEAQVRVVAAVLNGGTGGIEADLEFWAFNREAKADDFWLTVLSADLRTCPVGTGCFISGTPVSDLVHEAGGSSFPVHVAPGASGTACCV